MRLDDLLLGLQLVGDYVLLAALYYALIAYPLIKINQRRRRGSRP